MRVTITQTDIDKGKIGDCHLCPVARAIRRAVRGRKRVTVGCTTVEIGRWGHGLNKYWLPKKVTSFIFNFDDKCPVKPFTFNLTKQV